MKKIYEQGFGGDGAKAGLYVEEKELALKVTYPLEKMLSPVNAIIDQAINKLEAVIPGDWDKALLEPIRAEAKAQLLKLVSE